MVGARGALAGVELPDGARAITGTVRTPVSNALRPLRVAVTLLVTSSDGLALRLPAADAHERRPGHPRSPCSCPTWAEHGCGWPGSKPTAGWPPATPTDSRWTG